MAFVEPIAEEEQRVSAATLSGAAQAASHPNCNNWGPYHWTMEPKGMLQCPFDSELLYL
jgi:hypothetical protein